MPSSAEAFPHRLAHAPVAASDDHWKVAHLRAVAFLDCDVERIAVETSDGEIVKLTMVQNARGPTGSAGLGIGGRPVAVFAARGLYGTIIGRAGPRAKRWWFTRAPGARFRSFSNVCGRVGPPTCEAGSVGVCRRLIPAAHRSPFQGGRPKSACRRYPAVLVVNHEPAGERALPA